MCSANLAVVVVVLVSVAATALLAVLCPPLPGLELCSEEASTLRPVLPMVAPLQDQWLCRVDARLVELVVVVLLLLLGVQVKLAPPMADQFPWKVALLWLGQAVLW